MGRSRDRAAAAGPHGQQTTVLSAINGVTQQAGFTCIGCGLQVATEQLTVNTDPDRSRITVLLTDGVNNRPSNPAVHLQDQIAASEAAGIERFAIGVGNYNASELNQIASEPKADHVFTVDDFNELAGIVGAIVESLDKPAATDAIDGSPVPVTCEPASGATFPLGTTTVTCTATDAAGNLSEASFTVTVLSVDQLLQSLLDYVTGKGAGNSLRATVLAAQRAVDRGDLAVACNQLQALINEAGAQTPNHLTVEQRDWIIAAATDIRAALGC